MKRNLWVIVFWAVATVVFAQNGYQEYTFGTDIEVIKSKFQNIKETSYFFRDFYYIMQHLYKSELSELIPNPAAALGDEFRVLLTGEWHYDKDFYFLFSNNKLVGIVTFFNVDNILPEIKTKYGAGSTYGVTYRATGFSDEGIVWLNEQRFIVWQQHDGESSFDRFQTVSYIDASWIREVCRKRMQDFRKEQQAVRSRLD